MASRSNPTAALRVEALREALLATLELLKRRRAGDIPEGYIEAYVALDWLEWQGGTLRLTTVGDNVRKQLLAQAATDS